MTMFRGDWKRCPSMVALLVASIAMSCFLVRTATPQTLEDLRTQGLNVRDAPSSQGCWWITETVGKPQSECVEVAWRIRRSAAVSGSALNVTYGSVFINQYNNTVWLAVTDASQDRINQIEELIGSHDGVKIIYLKAPVLWTELRKYERLVAEKSMLLRLLGVKVSSVGASENATLLIFLEVVSPYTVKTLIYHLPEVPRHLLVIRRGGPIVLD